MSQKAQLEIAVATDKAIQELNKLKQKLQAAGTEGKQAGDKIDQGAQKGAGGINQLGAETKKTKRDMGALSVSVFGASQSITGLSDAIAGMKEKNIATERSTFGLEKTTLDLKRQQEDLNIAIQLGTISGLEYQRAVEDIGFAERDLAIETKELKAEQEALNSEWISFATNAGSTVLLTGIAINQMLSDSAKGFIRLKLASIANSKAIAASIPILNAATFAQVKATFASKGLAAGIKGIFVAMGPLGWAIIGIGAAWLAWETNLGGIQQRLDELWQWIKLIIPPLNSLSILVSNLFPEAAAQEVDNFNDSIKEGTETLSGYDLMLGKTNDDQNDFNTSLGSSIGVMAPIPDHYRKMTSDLDSYNKSLEKGTRVGDEWIKMQEKVSRLNQKKTNDSDFVIDPNTGEPKNVRRKKSLIDQSTFNAIQAFGGGIAGTFRSSSGAGRVFTNSLARRRELNRIENRRRADLRNKSLQTRLAKKQLATARRLGINARSFGGRSGLFRGLGQAHRSFNREFSDFGLTLRNAGTLSREDVEVFRQKIAFSQANEGLVGLGVSQLNVMQTTGEGMRTINNSLSYQDRVKMMSSGAS